jgi:oxygen-independent coproporphyrinogen-3 oxidase
MDDVMRWVARACRRYLAGPDRDFVLRPATGFTLPGVTRAGLYLHIPFCRSLCPYCPYNRIAYDPDLAEPYAQAVLAELARYAGGEHKIQASSLYIGGGTPTTMLNQLGPMLDGFHEVFDIVGEIALETTVGDITPDAVTRLRALGVDVLSLGVQSFDGRLLRAIGRTYNGDAAREAVRVAQAAGFQSLNVDLMFCLPGQTVQDFLHGLELVTQMGVDQVTCYPLFSFPYSTAGRSQDLPELRMPPTRERRAMYHAMHTFLEGHGYRRVSVWGFQKGQGPRYSSVTRDEYLGFGAGSGSHINGLSWFNTFSVSEYTAACAAGRSPVALSMPFTPAMERSFWLYWRLYDSSMDIAQLRDHFRADAGKLWLLLAKARALGMVREEAGRLWLTERGAFWIHLLQNEVALRAVDRIWGVCLHDPWPEEIQL